MSRLQWAGLVQALEQARQQKQFVTYRALIERLQLPVPAMQTLARALELLAAQDAKAKRPLRSALVISQGGTRLPRPGFFEWAEHLGLFQGAGDGSEAVAWHAAEVARVFEHAYVLEAE